VGRISDSGGTAGSGAAPACAADPGSAEGFAEARAATAWRRPGTYTRYLAEFDFSHNNRDISDAECADALLCGARGKRLLYRQPNKAPNA